MKSLEHKNRKTARPFSKTKALHIVLRSEVAVRELSMVHPTLRTWLRGYLPSLAKRFHVRLYSWSNNGNHLHLVVKAQERASISTFLRVLSGMIARKALGAERGSKASIRYWVKRPYSRIISWGREYWNVMRYVERNILEANGQIAYRARDKIETPQMKDYLFRRVLLNQMPMRQSTPI